MNDIFISYSSKDDVGEWRDRLESNGWKCWFAPRDLIPGDPYQAKIAEAIRDCCVLLFVLSRSSNASHEVPSEIALADLTGRQVVVLSLDETAPAETFRPWLVGCERVDHRDKTAVIAALERALARAEVARHSKFVALLLSVIPGAGLLLVQRMRAGAGLLAAGVLILFVSYFLELGTGLDRFLANVFHVLIFASVVATAHTVLGAISGSCNRTCRWLPYVASILAPGSGIAYAGRRRIGWLFCWLSVAAYAVMMCSGSYFTRMGCSLDATAYWCVWLLGVAESGFEDAQGRHRNPWLYSLIALLVVALICFNIPRSAFLRERRCERRKECAIQSRDAKNGK